MEKTEETTEGMNRHADSLELGITIIESKEGDGYIGYLNAMPGICTQAETIEDIKPRMMDAFKATMEFMENRNRKLGAIERIVTDKNFKLVLQDEEDQSGE